MSDTHDVRGVRCQVLRYPCRRPPGCWWYAVAYPAWPDGHGYYCLHRDGYWALSVAAPAGLFPTREAAEAVLLNNPNPVPG